MPRHDEGVTFSLLSAAGAGPTPQGDRILGEMPMKILALVIAAWLALTASIASADGFSLAWNDCLGAGGATV